MNQYNHCCWHRKDPVPVLSANHRVVVVGLEPPQPADPYSEIRIWRNHDFDKRCQQTPKIRHVMVVKESLQLLQCRHMLSDDMFCFVFQQIRKHTVGIRNSSEGRT